MRAYSTFPSLLALALFGLASRPAHAQSTCSSDSECVKGWTCQVSGGSSCGAAPCAPGEKCEQQPSDCANVEYKSCRPAGCSADSDCADGMVCYTHTETNCAPTACASGQECAAPVCEPKTESACVPRYVLPCATASDCGAGFSCESAGEQCTCSGSAGRGDDASDGGASQPPEPPDCTCQPSTELRCRAAIVTCDEDSDCSTTGWRCAQVASGSDCASTPESDPNPGSGAQGSGAPPPDCRPSAPVKQCMPPYYDLVQGIEGGDREDSAGIPTLGGGDANSGNGAVPGSAESDKDDATSSAAGCSVAHGSRAGSTVALLGVLGLFGALRRRRAR
jgi:MYXO-CTERM domain-containing protein